MEICEHVNRVAPMDIWPKWKTLPIDTFTNKVRLNDPHSKLVKWPWQRYAVAFIRLYMTSKLNTPPLGSGWIPAHWTSVRLDGSDYRLQMSGGQTWWSPWLYHIIVLVHGWTTTSWRGWTDSHLWCVTSASEGRKLKDFWVDCVIASTCNYRNDTFCFFAQDN